MARPVIPYNPGVRALVEGKRRSDRSIIENADCERSTGFRGWHERGYLPHRDSPNLGQFLTYHLANAFPRTLRDQWQALLQIEDDLERRRKLEAYLDRGEGESWLREPRIVGICEDAFLHFHARRYLLKAWCLMPNHVHVLVQVTDVPLTKIIQSWKGYTAYRCNQILNQSGTQFWAEGYWDTYIRSRDHERRVIRYIENNPVKARLVRTPTDWAASSARYRTTGGELVLPAPEN